MDILSESLLQKPVIKTTNLSIGYGSKVLKSKIELSGLKGEQIAVIGANGSGKSTLLRTLAALQPALSGSVELFEKPMQDYSVKAKAKALSFVAATPLYDRYMTTEELVRLGRFPYSQMLGKIRKTDKKIIENALEIVGLKHLSHAKITEISDGERQKALIAGALAQDSPIVILDEPVSFLDPENSFAVLNILKDLTEKQNKTVIYSTHDISSALHRADKVWLFKDANISEGSPEDLILNNSFDRLFNLPDIFFDKISSSFRQKPKLKNTVYIQDQSNNENLLVGLKKTTKRLGFRAILSENRQNPDILLSSDSEILMLKKHKYIKVNDFYTLAHILKERN
jgi:iron complex transport system ATP-binding protein